MVNETLLKSVEALAAFTVLVKLPKPSTEFCAPASVKPDAEGTELMLVIELIFPEFKSAS